MPDSFHEVNGVAHTSRNFQAYAERHNLPFLCIRAGKLAEYSIETTAQQHNQLRTLECRRSPFSVPLEKDLYFDLLYLRYASEISRQLRDFRPDIIHITGPSELGILGAYFAWKMNIPLAASWHTNIHEYAARRSARLLSLLPNRWGTHAEKWIEDGTLNATARFYRLARVLFAPNRELCDLLSAATNKPCLLMQRGVDTDAFSPAHRTRPELNSSDNDGTIVLGYAGRLSVEKNVALLASIQDSLLARGFHHVRFLIIGHGDEEPWLRRHLPNAQFTGVLRGQALQRAYTNMDIFLFPSHTDTFGNVVLEALSSGVPAIVTPDGGPKYIVRDAETGFITHDQGFATAVETLLRNPDQLQTMRLAARNHALTCSWDAVFNHVYAAYNDILAPQKIHQL